MRGIGKRVAPFGVVLLTCCFVSVAWRQATAPATGPATAPGIAPVIKAAQGPNAPEQRGKPYVVLVSLDGFRYDYAKRYGARHLLELAARGASAPEGMLPSYPSITFPNHVTLVTGLYPEHHGIVANTFYDPGRKEVYSYRDAQTVTDGTWYGGTPLWVLAEQQGMRAACFFWVGSEAAIQGTRPAYYLKYDRSFPNEKRVAQVLEWLRLPPEERPHFITLYFSDVDTAGHAFGPESPQVASAVAELDTQIGRLMAGIEELKLPIDVIVLADHGMVKVDTPTVYLDAFGLKAEWFERTVGPNLYPKSEADAQSAYAVLHGASQRFQVYRRADVPAHLHYDSNPREGDPVVVPAGPYSIQAVTDPLKPPPPVGEHGFDPSRIPEMKALFVAAGPDIRAKATVAPFENVHVYPLVAKILGLDIAHLKTGPIDGRLEVLKGILRDKKPGAVKGGRSRTEPAGKASL